MLSSTRRLQLSISGVVVLLLLAGCSAPPPAPTATPGPLTAATTIAARGAREAQFVIMGDLLLYDSASHYVGYLEQDLGVKVTLIDYTTGDHAMSSLLKRVRTDERVRKAIREADALMFDVGFQPFAYALATYVSPGRAECGGADSQDCLREALGQYKADADALFAEIVSLRRPSEAIIRTMDAYESKVKETKGAGAFEVVNGYWRQANEHVIQLAGKHHIPVARVYEAFLGASGDEDPRDKGLAESDGVRPTEKGKELIAGLFRKLGYEYAPKP